MEGNNINKKGDNFMVCIILFTTKTTVSNVKKKIFLYFKYKDI